MGVLWKSDGAVVATIIIVLNNFDAIHFSFHVFSHLSRNSTTTTGGTHFMKPTADRSNMSALKMA